ncbi:Reverse transcriptase (RNA-dependent DNA polymerase) [Fragilaria crotonensis]|nr:Reverse transcriptase (RNA-dependent DNA polymerase) [Fragilaria crotonensis]
MCSNASRSKLIDVSSQRREALEAYVKKNLKFAEDLTPLFSEEMENPQLEMPVELDPEASIVEKAIWDQELREFVKRKSAFKGNLATIQAVVLGQCSEAMKDKLKSLTEFKSETKINNCFWLLQQIRSITLQFDEKKNGFISIMNAQRSFLNCKQQVGQSPASYLEDLRAWAVTIDHHGGTIAVNYKLIPAVNEDGTAVTDDDRRSRAYEKTLAIALITGSDPSRYGTLVAHLSNQYAMGRDEYPSNVTAAYNLLVNYRTPENTTRPRQQQAAPNATGTTRSDTGSGMTFAQQGSVAGNNGLTHDGIECYQCHSVGHYASNCPEGTATTSVGGTTLTQYAYMMAQADASRINPEWILLDSQSTISVFNNASMLTDIRKSTHTLRALTNGGHQDSNMVGDFHNLGIVWYNPQSIANILSLADVRKVCRVTLDTSTEPALCVHRLDGSIMKFVEHGSGLYVYDTAVRNSPTISDNVAAYTMVSTVANQKKLFSRRQISAADVARDLYRKIGRPDEAEFRSILIKQQIRNCPVTPDDAHRALLIYGPDVATLKGKTTRGAAAPRAPTFEAVPLPPPIAEHHCNVTLCVDFFFVQGIAFLHTISRGIGFRTVSQVADRTHKTILRSRPSSVSTSPGA